MGIIKAASIRRRFTLGLALVLTVITLLFSGGMIIYNSRSIENELNEQLVKLIRFSQQSLASALWQYNYEYVQDYLDSLFLYEDLVFASVADEEKAISSRTHPKFSGSTFENFRTSSKFITAETIVVYDQIKVGTVQLALSKERIDDLVVVASTVAILILLVLNLAVFGTNFFMSRRYLFKPLDKLEKTVGVIAAGNLNASIDISGKDEIGQLARSFKLMMENLRKITTSRDELNREVQERKKVEQELKRSLREKEILLKEVHHRVKNNMQIVQSLLNLQSTKLNNLDLNRAIQDSNNRIRSMALIHETLYRSDNFSHLDLKTYFESIVKGLYKVYLDPRKTVEWQIRIDQVELDLDKSIACGLIVNELVTNSLKYAFGRQQKGSVFIRLSQTNNGQAVLSVSDDGIGIPENFDWESIDSLGLRIVRMLSEDQLDGELDYQSDKGLSVHIKFQI